MKDDCMATARPPPVKKLGFIIHDTADRLPKQFTLETQGSILAGIEMFGIGFGRQVLGTGVMQLEEVGECND